MSGAELQAWWLYYQLEPWGETRADLRMGILGATLVNLWMAKGSKPVRPIDFMPDFFPATPAPAPAQRQTPQQMFAMLLQGTQAAGGRIDQRFMELSAAPESRQ